MDKLSIPPDAFRYTLVRPGGDPCFYAVEKRSGQESLVQKCTRVFAKAVPEGYRKLDMPKDITLLKGVLSPVITLVYVIGVALLVPLTLMATSFLLFTRFSIQEIFARYIALVSQKQTQEEVTLSKERELKKLEDINSKRGNNPIEFSEESYLESETKRRLYSAILKPRVFQDKPIEDQKWILYLKGKGGGYEGEISFYARLAAELGVGVIAVNYMGVGRSEGMTLCSDDLVKAGKATMDHLFAKGVASKNVLVYGYCIGGAASARIARDCHQDGKYVSCLTDRSFSQFSDIFDVFTLPIFGPIFSYMAKTWWPLNLEENFRQLHSKECRFRGVITAGRDDFVVSKNASAARVLQDLKKEIHWMHIRRPVKEEASLMGRVSHGGSAHLGAVCRPLLREWLKPFLKESTSGQKQMPHQRTPSTCGEESRTRRDLPRRHPNPPPVKN